MKKLRKYRVTNKTVVVIEARSKRQAEAFFNGGGWASGRHSFKVEVVK